MDRELRELNAQREALLEQLRPIEAKLSTAWLRCKHSTLERCEDIPTVAGKGGQLGKILQYHCPECGVKTEAGFFPLPEG